MYRFYAGLIMVIVAGSIFCACAPSAYKETVTTARNLESRQDYEQAYQYYQKALQLEPDNAAMKRKLEDLGKSISTDFTRQAVHAFEKKQHQTAQQFIDKALRYNPANSRAQEYREQIAIAYKAIELNYAAYDKLAAKNQWIKAAAVLKEISRDYAEDPGLEQKIEDTIDQGYAYYRNAANRAHNAGDYEEALRHAESAQAIKPSEEGASAVERAKRFLQADNLYHQSQRLYHAGDLMPAMKTLLQARDLAPGHTEVKQCIAVLKPEWTPQALESGKQYLRSTQVENAMDIFSQLMVVSPQYPEVQTYYEEATSLYLKTTYALMVRAYRAGSYEQALERAYAIFEKEPEFLDTKELMARSAFKAFNAFFQQGLHYLSTGNYGKAILCFTSAERQLGTNHLTRKYIDESWEKIRDISALHCTILEFSEDISEPGAGRYIAHRLRTAFDEILRENPFRNVTLACTASESQPITYRTPLADDIDWGALISDGYNSVITGTVKMLRIDRAVNSEWKTRKQKTRQIVDNEEYTRLVMRRAELMAGLKADKRDRPRHPTEDRPMKRGEMDDELRDIEERLPLIPPKVEREVEEEIPCQLVKHTMTAHMRIEVAVLSPVGGNLWPLQRYEDTFTIEDSVVPPNLKSDDPRERQGDPLTLPSDSAFREQALDYMIQKKIVPDLLADFRDYGITFYENASAEVHAQEDLEPYSTAFLEAIEEYYKFLACFCPDNPDEQALKEKVEKELHSCVCDQWLIRK